MQHDEREPGTERPAEGVEPEADESGAERPAAGSEPAPDEPREPHEATEEPAGEPLDPTGAAAESTKCPRCGTENRAGLAFCRSCGQRLLPEGAAPVVERPGAPEGTMACPRCGTHNRSGVAFCQNCGANLRGVGPGYVPPAAAMVGEEERRGGAVLGPVVLLIGLVGLVTGYLLPFAYGSGSLWERASGEGGYGIAFWAAYPEVGAALVDQIYYGLAGPLPLLMALVAILAIAGFIRAAPGPMQTVALAITLVWSLGLAVTFVIVELVGGWDGDLVALLSSLTPAGIIFLLASLIVVIGTLTRLGRS